MKYVTVDSSNLITIDKPTLDFFVYPTDDKIKRIKVVSNDCYIKNIKSHNLARSLLFWFRTSSYTGSSFGMPIVYCFDDNKYYYMFFNHRFHKKYFIDYIEENKNNQYALKIHGATNPLDCDISLMNCPFTVQNQEINLDDFPIIDDPHSFDFKSLTEYENTVEEDDPHTKRSNIFSGPATCSCGYISEYLVNVPDYVCPQCKIWNYVAS